MRSAFAQTRCGASSATNGGVIRPRKPPVVGAGGRPLRLTVVHALKLDAATRPRVQSACAEACWPCGAHRTSVGDRLGREQGGQKRVAAAWRADIRVVVGGRHPQAGSTLLSLEGADQTGFRAVPMA